MLKAVLVVIALSRAQSQQILEARQTPAIEQQDKTGGNAPVRPQQQQPTGPTKVALEGSVTVINQPDPKQEQRDADQKAQTRFANGVQIGTLIFVALAAGGAIGAWLANRRSATAAETQVGLLTSQIADAQKDATEQRRIALEALADTRQAAEAATSSADIARDLLLIENRPRIRIRSVGIQDYISHQQENRVAAQVQLANVGATDATNVRARSHWFIWQGGLPIHNPIAQMEFFPPPASERIVKPGDWLMVDVDREPPPNLHREAYIWAEGGDEYVAGIVRYNDGAGRPRLTAFCRRLDPITRRFERVNDPEYEYED